MKEKIFELRDKVKNGEITLKEAQEQFLFLYDVSKPLLLKGITYDEEDVFIVKHDHLLCRQIINNVC